MKKRVLSYPHTPVAKHNNPKKAPPGIRSRAAIPILTLASLAALLFSCTTAVYAEIDKDTTDFETVVDATRTSNQDYQELRKKLFDRYSTIIVKMEQAESGYTSIFSGTSDQGLSLDEGSMPEGFSPWWQSRVNNQLNTSVPNIAADVTTLFTKALQYSSQIKVFSDLPLIRETTIQEAEGPYDFRLFAEGRLTDLDEPVGDDLKTGGPMRYEEHSKNLAYGLRKKFLAGTEVELKQNIGDMDTNSTFFNPEDQARSGTYLTIKQPLLKRFGIAYNRSPIDLATIDHSIAGEELRRNVESHLLEVTRAYWGLYMERSLLLQKEQLAQKSLKIYQQMQQRTDMDVDRSLLARAKSQVSAHKLAAMQAEYAMLNAQSRIRALVNDPAMLSASGMEMVTRQLPSHKLFDVSFDKALQTTLKNRPEVAQAIKHIQSAYLRLQRSENELMPDLDLFFQTYVKGLEGDYEYGTAYSNQFDEGGPSYVAGLRFEFPLGNNGAEARNLRKKLEIRQLLHQLDTTVENVLLETQVSYRELVKNYRSMVQSYQIMRSDDEEVKALLARIDYLLTKNDPYGDVLYRLLDANERLTDSEELFAKSELTYNYSQYNLYRAMGILVSTSDINFEEQTKDTADGLPVMHVRKNADPHS
ncbi:MAG TPA: TolC family protein [Desulfobulbus sp.]|nr:TolC family protein [Desulfobulbus sp.]